MELDYHLLLAKDVGLLPLSDYSRLSADVVKLRSMLGRFISTLATQAAGD
jgi:hypothetical protein